MDLLTGWDFNRSSDKTAAARHIDEQAPLLVIGSPMCTMFSTLQQLQPHDAAWHERLRKAKGHIKFAVAMYRRQRRQGRYFLHEHPASASSWQLPVMQGLVDEHDGQVVTIDQCMYGQMAVDQHGNRGPV